MSAILECTFKPGMVSAAIRSGPSTSFSIVGYVMAKNENVFKVTKEGASGNWHKLVDGRGFVSVETYYLTIKEIGGDPPQPAPPPEPVKSPPKPYTPPPKKETKLESSSTSSAFSKGQGSSTAEEIYVRQDSGSFPPVVGYQNGMVLEDYYMDYSFIKDSMDAIRNNFNLGTGSDARNMDQTLLEKFDRFKTPKPDLQLGKSFAHIFFTRPDLNLYESLTENVKKLNPAIEKDPIYYYLYKNSPKILETLTSDFSKNHDFNPLLSNYAQSFELSDEVIKTMEIGETFTGWKTQYGKNNIESKTAGSFSISYTDDRDFHIYKIHKAWIDYISKVYRGEIMAKDKYRRKSILDYACSVYYILCGEDGETIIFWSKYTGVFPTNTPAASLSSTKGNLLKMPEFSINYMYSWKDDFNPVSLAEFNKNSNGDLKYVKTYEKSLLTTGKSMSGSPFIETTPSSSGGKYSFKLRFRYK